MVAVHCYYDEMKLKQIYNNDNLIKRFTAKSAFKVLIKDLINIGLDESILN